MRFYENIDFTTSDTKYFDFRSGEYRFLRFLKLCDISKKEDMEDINLTNIRHNNTYGIAAVGTYPTRGGVIKKVLSYAAIKGFEDTDDQKLAVVGNVITLPSARGRGLGTRVVQEVLKRASDYQALAEHGHCGFKAVCNPESQRLFLNLGFEISDNQPGKYTLIKKERQNAQ